MTLISRAIRNAAADFRAAGPWSGEPPVTPWGANLGGSAAMTEAAALSVATVVNCVRVISDDMGILPFRAMSGDPHGSRKILGNQPQIVVEPFGPDLSPQNGFGQIAASIKLRGRAYCYITQRDRYGYPRQLQILHPDLVTPRINDAGRKVFRIRGIDYPKDDFVHLKGLMLPGAIDGLDPVTYQRITLGLAVDMNEFSRNLFLNGAVLSGVVEAKGEGDRKRARDIASAFQANHGGVANAHKVGVLFDAEWKPMSITPENAQFLASKAFVREEIAGWYGVPLQRLMVIAQHASQGGGKGLDTIDQGYATHTLLPLARQIETMWDRMIPGGMGTWTEFDFSGLLRASALERAQIQNLRRVAGTATINENRREEGLPPLADPRADDPFMPLNSNTSTPIPADETTDGDQSEPDGPAPDKGTK